MTRAKQLADFARVLPTAFSLRSELVAWVAANPAQPDGTVVTAGGLQYVWQTGGTLISDTIIPAGGRGLVPFGHYTPFHYGAAGDGVADDGPAVKAAAATGRDVYFPESGTFLMNGWTIICAHSGQRFYGKGRLLKTVAGLQDPADPYLGANDGAKFIKINGVNSVTIDGVIFDHTPNTNTRCYGVTVENAARTKVVNNRFLTNVSPIFVWNNSDQTDFINNQVTGGLFGFVTGGDALGNTTGSVTRTRCIGNTFLNTRAEAIDINWDTTGCIIADNVIINSNVEYPDEAIDVGGGVCRDIIIHNNLIYGGANTLRGIWIKLGTSNVKITGNIISGQSIATNTHGVRVTSSGADGLASVDVSGNTMTGFRWGVLAMGSSAEMPIRGLNICGNIIAARAGGSNRGIDVNFTEKLLISENDVSGFTEFGVILNTGCKFSEVSKNHIFENANSGLNCLAPGTIIDGNHVFLNGIHGINLQATHITCTGNQSYDNATVTANSYAIVLTAGSNLCVVSGNKCYDTRTTKLMRGLIVTGACDKCVVTGNIINDTLNGFDVIGGNLLTNSEVASNVPAAGWVA